MKNITVSVPDEVYHKARVYAAEHKTSVSKLVQEQLVKLSAGDIEQRRVERLRAFFEEFDRSRTNGPHLRASDNMTRDEVHDRDALRKEHNDALRELGPDAVR